MRFRTITPETVRGKKVLVRVDFNVPMKNGTVTDDTRVRAHRETMEILGQGAARVVLVSHLGRPKGIPSEDLSTKQLIPVIEKVYGKKVRFCEQVFGPEVELAMAEMEKQELLLLENVRFYPEEKKNDQGFARKLAKPFDLFVMDAFSASHRAHASTNAIQRELPSYAGKLMEKEVTTLGSVKENPQKPFILILGGAKVSDKIGVLETLLPRSSAVLIGGGMAFTFLKAKGYEIGSSLLEEDKLDFARAMIRKAEDLNVDLVLPKDIIVADSPDPTQEPVLVDVDSIPSSLMGLDIGPASVDLFSDYLSSARTVLWNGPMGVFEKSFFEKGTSLLASRVAEMTDKGAFTVVGGGDTAAAVKKFGFHESMSHISTGGGASLEFFENKVLPGIEPLLIE